MRMMNSKKLWTAGGVAWLAMMLLAPAGLGADKLRLLIISGSHPFQTNEFFQLFKDNPAVEFTAAAHPNAHAYLRPEAVKAFDVIVLYDYWQKITEEAKGDFVNALKSGKGLVILHHAVADYQAWPEYEKILGGRYYMAQKTVVNGVEKPRSKARHGEDIKVQVADPEHPVTRGVKNFTIRDESYFGYDIQPDSHVILTTDHTNNAPHLAWTRTYEASRVVYLQLGHDRFAYEHPSYRQLVAQAIRWVARKE